MPRTRPSRTRPAGGPTAVPGPAHEIAPAGRPHARRRCAAARRPRRGPRRVTASRAYALQLGVPGQTGVYRVQRRRVEPDRGRDRPGRGVGQHDRQHQQHGRQPRAGPPHRPGLAAGRRPAAGAAPAGTGRGCSRTRCSRPHRRPARRPRRARSRRTRRTARRRVRRPRRRSRGWARHRSRGRRRRPRSPRPRRRPRRPRAAAGVARRGGAAPPRSRDLRSGADHRACGLRARAGPAESPPSASGPLPARPGRPVRPAAAAPWASPGTRPR
jgi:hypothetical protein